MNRKPYKRFENLLLALVMMIPVLAALGIALIATYIIGSAQGLLMLGAVLFLAVVVTIVLLMRETRSLRKEHEARVERVVRFTKNLRKDE